MTESSGIGIDGFELRFDTDPSETGRHWEIWQDGEFVVSGRTGAEAIGALASVANSEGWYTDSDGNPWPLMSEKVTQETITDITTLEKGDGVLFEGLSSPLIVVSTATSASDEVQLQGPEGANIGPSAGPDCPDQSPSTPVMGVSMILSVLCWNKVPKTTLAPESPR